PTLAHQTATLVLDPFCGSGSTLLAAEILETDFWIQYNELGGVQDSEVPGGSGSHKYTKALEVLDGDMPQYIHDNTEDEMTHFSFINAYLSAKGTDYRRIAHCSRYHRK